jgi:hypothetical protein
MRIANPAASLGMRQMDSSRVPSGHIRHGDFSIRTDGIRSNFFRRNSLLGNLCTCGLRVRIYVFLLSPNGSTSFLEQALHPKFPLIRKPFLPDDLVRVVNAKLDPPAASS